MFSYFHLIPVWNSPGKEVLALWACESTVSEQGSSANTSGHS